MSLNAFNLWHPKTRTFLFRYPVDEATARVWLKRHYKKTGVTWRKYSGTKFYLAKIKVVPWNYGDGRRTDL